MVNLNKLTLKSSKQNLVIYYENIGETVSFVRNHHFCGDHFQFFQVDSK